MEENYNERFCDSCLIGDIEYLSCIIFRSGKERVKDDIMMWEKENLFFFIGMIIFFSHE